MGRRRSKKQKKSKQKKTASRGSRKTSAKKRTPSRTKVAKAEKPLWKRPWFVVVVACVLIGVAIGVWYFVIRDSESESGEKVMQWSESPAMEIDATKKYTATIRTEKGDIVVDLFADKAPKTVSNFVFLARQGYYDNVTFHRVIPGFMAQTGDPTGTGRGGPGYSFEDEFHPDLRHDSEGILSMANSGPGTNGSQFFITYGPTPHLDDLHTVFGKVREGMDVLRSLRERDPATDTEPGDLIVTISITEE